MVSRKQRWGATSLPAVRWGFVRALGAEAARHASLADVAAQVGVEGPAPEVMTEMSSSAGLATLYWVTPPMAWAAMDAALDAPAIRAEDCPDLQGLIAFGVPLPPLDLTPVGGLALRDGLRTDVQHDEPVPVDALLWSRSDSTLRVDVLTLTSRLPHPLLGVDSPLSPIMGITVDLPAHFGEPMAALGPVGVAASGEHVGILSLLSACWVLMMTPTVGDRTSIDGDTGGAAGAGTPEDRQVTLIDLRPLRYADVDEPEVSGRRLSKRHLVRGHWTHQPYGPGRSLRRLQWIATYVKGPEGAPWSTTERVMVWRR